MKNRNDAVRRFAFAGLFALASMLHDPASAQLSLDAPVRAALLAERDGIAPGQSLTVAVQLLHGPRWHTYWRMPGDAGLPTRIRWRLPAGFKASEIGWPLPQRLALGGVVDYGYEGEALLLVEITAPAAPTGTQFAVGASVDWLMCREVCIPGHADLQTTLQLRDPAAIRSTPWSAQIEQARARLPRPLRLDRATAHIEANRVRLRYVAAGKPPATLEFLPLEHGRIDAAAPQTLAVAGNVVTLDLSAAGDAPADVESLHGVLVGDGGPGHAGGWAGEIEVPLLRHQ